MGTQKDRGLSSTSVSTFEKHLGNKQKMGEFTFPEFRRRISRSITESGGNSLCESSALDEVNQVVEKLGGVKSIEQSYCNQEVSETPNPNARKGLLGSGIFSSLGKNQMGGTRCASISETVESKQFTGNANLSQQLGKSVPDK